MQPIQHDFATCWLNVKPLSGRYCSRCSSSLYPAAQRQKFPTVERKILLFRYFRCGFVRSTAWQNQKSLYKIDSLHIKIAPMEICTEQQSSARTAPEPSRPERLICSHRRRYIPATVLCLSAMSLCFVSIMMTMPVMSGVLRDENLPSFILKCIFVRYNRNEPQGLM